MKDSLLLLTFILGVFAQTLIMIPKAWKEFTFRGIFLIYLLVTGFFMILDAYTPDADLSRMPLLALFLWAWMAGVVFFNRWFHPIKIFSFLMDNLAFWYALSLFIDISAAFKGFFISTLVIFVGHYAIGKGAIIFKIPAILYYLVLLIGIAISQAKLIDFLVIFDPSKPVPFGYAEMLIGGMMFQYIAMHAAILHFFLAMPWAGLIYMYKYLKPILERLHHYKQKEMTPQKMKPVNTSGFNDKYYFTSLGKAGLLGFLALCIFFYFNRIYAFLPHFWIITFGYFVIPQILNLSARQDPESLKS